jgi:hypothetical protein
VWRTLPHPESTSYTVEHDRWFGHDDIAHLSVPMALNPYQLCCTGACLLEFFFSRPCESHFSCIAHGESEEGTRAYRSNAQTSHKDEAARLGLEVATAVVTRDLGVSQRFLEQQLVPV